MLFNNQSTPSDDKPETTPVQDSVRPKDKAEKSNTPNPEQFEEQLGEGLRMKPQPLEKKP